MAERDYNVTFPTLFVLAAWIEHHCIIPDGFRKGQEFRLYDWQLWITLNHYRVNEGADAYDDEGYPTRSAAFFNRRSQVIAPQKTGKGPFAAAITCAEAVGPALFAGWASEGDVYACADHGCPCGWVYPYLPGEPMGMPWPTPLIQLLATSEDQVDNVYRPLQAMARGPFLSHQMMVREGFIRLPNDGRIDVVTSSAQSRLGNPITFALQDETQLYTATNKLIKVAETMRRGLAGMGGRSMETTNTYDPAEQSVAQRTYESTAKDVFKFYEQPPPDLRYSVKSERRKIHEFNYKGSPHVNLDSIEAEAAEIAETDPAQAERFYGNRIVAGLGSWLDGDRWDSRRAERDLPGKGEQIVYGMDGSDVDDWTGIRAETQDGYQFTPQFADGTPMIWNPRDHGGQVPRLVVHAAIDRLHTHYRVVRAYIDPPYWESEIDEWAEKYGDKIVLRWATYRPTQMHNAAERMVTDVAKVDSEFSHDGCQITTNHVKSAKKAARLQNRYVLTKPGDGRKIDLAVSSILCHEAWGDVTNAKLWKQRYRAYSA